MSFVTLNEKDGKFYTVVSLSAKLDMYEWGLSCKALGFSETETRAVLSNFGIDERDAQDFWSGFVNGDLSSRLVPSEGCNTNTVTIPRKGDVEDNIR